MKKIKVGINGFGRSGRLALRASWNWPEFEFVQINDPAGDAATLAHLLNFDSVHGRWQHEAVADGDAIVIGGTRIPVTRNRELAATNWSGCDVVLEASGKFRKPDVLQPYLDQGVKRVVVTAPVKSPGVLDVVVGVNHHRFDPAQPFAPAVVPPRIGAVRDRGEPRRELAGVEHRHDEIGVEHGPRLFARELVVQPAGQMIGKGDHPGAGFPGDRHKRTRRLAMAIGAGPRHMDVDVGFGVLK